MTEQIHRLLHVNPETVTALGFALERAIDDLEARARLAERCGDEAQLGEDSAREYRADLQRLTVLLDQLDGFQARDPDPEGDALAWFDGLYTIRRGEPIPVAATGPFEQLLQIALRRSRAGHVTGVELATALEQATGTPRNQHLERARHRRRTVEPDIPALFRPAPGRTR